jgi:hypothetical protein
MNDLNKNSIGNGMQRDPSVLIAENGSFSAFRDPALTHISMNSIPAIIPLSQNLCPKSLETCLRKPHRYKRMKAIRPFNKVLEQTWPGIRVFGSLCSKTLFLPGQAAQH